MIEVIQYSSRRTNTYNLDLIAVGAPKPDMGSLKLGCAHVRAQMGSMSSMFEMSSIPSMYLMFSMSSMYSIK